MNPKVILGGRSRGVVWLRAVWLLCLCIGATSRGLAQPPQALPIPNSCPQQRGGPPPCRDQDGDGFCDSWERAQRIPGGAQLPDADPSQPDIYVYYDWMDYGLGEKTCVTDGNCTAGRYHQGETCGGVGTSYEGRCTYACTVDSDCTSRWPEDVHLGERCIQNACQHTHDPMVLDSGELGAVVQRFAAHGIRLHLARGHAVPHSQVVAWRRDDQMQIGCEGANGANVGVGKYAVSFYDLKPAEASPQVYHYTVFGHYSMCDSIAHCSACPTPGQLFGQGGIAEISGNDFIVSLGGLIDDTGSSPHFTVASTFMHELGHNLGLRHDGHLDPACVTDGDCAAGDTCADLGDGEGFACHEVVNGSPGAEESSYKPNYLSIMNYRYGRGIEVGNALGSRLALECDTDAECGGDGGMCVSPGGARTPGKHCSSSAQVCATNADCPRAGESCLSPEARPGTCSLSAYVCSSDSECGSGETCWTPSKRGTCVRLDYSRQTLPAGGPIPGALDEASLDDTLGLGSGTTDIFRHFDGRCSTGAKPAASTGPVNWAGTGVLVTPSGDLFLYAPESFTDTGVQADVDASSSLECAVDPRDILHGRTDWPDLSGVPFRYKFQCTAPQVTGLSRRHVP